MKKLIIIIAAIIAVLVASISIASYAYSKSDDYTGNKFPSKTKINGIDCSNLTYEQAESKLADKWNQRHLVVTGKLNDRYISFTDFGYTYDLIDQLEKSKKRFIIPAAVNHFIGTPLDINIPMIVKAYDKDFKEEIEASQFFTIKNPVDSSDAYVDISDPDFPIIHEVYGTKTDYDKLFNDITVQIQTGKLHFIFDERNYYSTPKVTADDPELKEYQKYCRKYLSQRITYKLGDKTFTISPEDLNEFFIDTKTGLIDEAAVSSYVDRLAEEYDNVGIERNFTSLTGHEVTVSGGTYGWKIDRKAETEQLIQDLQSHKDVSRKPVFSIEGHGTYSDSLGNTYIDVDVTRQVVNYYKDGELIYNSNCVTGCRANGTTTDIGTFYIINKIQNVVLRGQEADGSEYASPVSYWLGVNWAGEGFHDANWRRNFGGDIWKYNGSHGCINMPPSRMGELYRKAEIGVPVVVHY